MADEPYVPEVRRLYWLKSVLLDAEDPEPERPAVVLLISKKPGREIFVGLRSSSEDNGTRRALETTSLLPMRRPANAA